MKPLPCAVLAMCAIAVAPIGASAYRTKVAQEQAAVRLRGCQAFIEKLYRTNTGRLVEPGHGGMFEWREAPEWHMHLGAGFTNLDRRVVRAVDVRYTIYDPSGARRAYYDATWRGWFVPHGHYDYTATGFKIAPIPAVPVKTITCSIVSVRYRPIREAEERAAWRRVADERSLVRSAGGEGR
jgi:hypothetical protein